MGGHFIIFKTNAAKVCYAVVFCGAVAGKG